MRYSNLPVARDDSSAEWGFGRLPVSMTAGMPALGDREVTPFQQAAQDWET